MALSQTAPLREAVADALPRRPFGLRFWDGSDVPATEPDSPTLTFKTPQALAHVLRAPGELGLGRAYVAGMIEVDDLEGALRMVDTFEPPPLSLRQRAELAVAVLRACGVVALPPVPKAELRLQLEDLAAEGRLTYVAGGRRTAEMLMVGDGDDIFEVSQIHGRP